MRVPLGLRLAVLGDVDLAAEDRLHAVLLGLLDELNRPGERAVVGEPDGRHLELGGARRELGNAARPVENRVLGVDVKVNERGLTHGAGSVYGAGPLVPRSRPAVVENHLHEALGSSRRRLPGHASNLHQL